jgi:hypothetical protein
MADAQMLGPAMRSVASGRPYLADTAHAILYEIDARSWLARLSREAGRRVRLGDVPSSAIDDIRASGADLVWLMGVWRTGAAGRRMARDQPEIAADARAILPDFEPDDIVGSPFAVADYEVALALGGDEGLARLRQHLARAGLGLVLDFVPNQG